MSGYYESCPRCGHNLVPAHGTYQMPCPPEVPSQPAIDERVKAETIAEAVAEELDRLFQVEGRTLLTERHSEAILATVRSLLPAQPADERVKETQQDAVKLIDQLEGIEDLLSRGPWEASQPDPFPYKVTIGNYTFDCPVGSSQIRAEQSSIPSRCLIPSGIIHYDDAEGIVELRNLIPTLIATLRSLLPVQPAQIEPLLREVCFRYRQAAPWLGELSKHEEGAYKLLGQLEDAVAAAEKVCPIYPVQPAQQEDDGWVTFGRIKSDIETETETFERIPVQPAAASDHTAITTDWEQTNARRHELIDAKQSRDLTAEEQAEFKNLQRLADLKREMLTAASTPTDSTIEKIMNQQPLDPKIAKALNEDFGELYEGTPTTAPDFTERQLVEQCVTDASRVPCDCEDLWCVHWKDEVSSRIASFASEAATQGQAVGIERAASVAQMWATSHSCNSHDSDPCCHVRTGTEIERRIKELSPDPSYLDQVRNEAATAERERIQKAVGLLPLHVREIPGSSTAQSFYLAEDIFAITGNDHAN